ncbi:MAG: SUMF1/EgtB/PvdO family nonheme iron enzyme [Clostridia bacterium]|nr:SUMF1/EgtB/PvdO family nonheme iron enzyme [Clostridia bacterium]MDD4386476.1 SUMF1/EgtB/PvdO family nonheme iron enzyme [Clostridia bacterium]
MKRKKGISLIVLVITIIVIIILAGAVILSLANNNPIESANEATFKSNVAGYNSELAMAITNEYLKDNSFDSATFYVDVWDGTGTGDGTIKEYITSMSEVDGAKFEIQKSKLVYVGTNQIEKDYLTEIGITSILGVNVIAVENTTVNGKAATYQNPIVPTGFKAINDGKVWPTDWNEGIVIEDVSGNQFVWVPVDGTDVTYIKWCTTGSTYADTTDDTLPSGMIEINQINSYGGFYIARYEAMFDYNGGNIRVASKVSTNKTNLIDWSSTRNATYDGYVWNFVDYTDAKSYAENMDTSYGYDTSKVGTNLMTGTQWDTAMRWISNNSGPSVTDSRIWGNHINSTSPANVGNGTLQISGFSENWKAKNIYDLAGNTWEWTNEIYSSYCVYRGGSYCQSGITDSAACRYNNYANNASYDLSFRTSLYIL